MNIFLILLTIYYIYCFFAIIPLLLDNREPGQTFAWMFLIIFLPGLGFFIYLITGRNRRRSYDDRKRLPQAIAKNLVDLFKPLNDRQEEMIQTLKKRAPVYQDDLMTLLYRNSHALLTLNNKVRVFHEGQEKFDSLIADIKNAKKFIHLQYFIWVSNDELGKKMKELLLEKVKEGVQIRILFDYSGCLFLLKRKYILELRKAGVEIYPFFNYLANWRIHTINYRNHRKIAVIDGNIGYTGGMNIAQEYIDGGKRFDAWRDTHIRIEGDAVSSLQAVFAVDWFNTTGKEDIFNPEYFTAIPNEAVLEGNLPIQITTSGYDTQWYSILQLYFTFITAAQKNIYIVSPYFIPDAALLMALKTAAMRGVKVVVVMTGVPDNFIPFWAAFSYFNELLLAGVRIFQYKAGFLHAKMLSIDGRISSIGSANFDIRSLKLNYEINAVFYQEELTKQIDAQIEKDIARSKEVLMAQMTSASLFMRLRSSLMRLVSGVL